MELEVQRLREDTQSHWIVFREIYKIIIFVR